ncbi:PREDICTED: uncharacterized protein LOC108367288 [Rhagoletis zephyria]|uniref:uncharacterized protein LOC108367288 n=1 Tax=Rhagoletis zephyria TaxID=28612 RepID=UPI00081178A9|nr:PREDICTED: uncharacterized protein LOC108367288 [Rhagoletis zephyria]
MYYMCQAYVGLFSQTISNLDFDDDQPSCSNSPQIPHSKSGEMIEEMVEFVEEAPITGAITPAGRKRKRVKESHERFDRLCGSIEAVIASKARYTDSDNSAFLQMLDECLKKKPDHVRERLKIELLTHAYNAN